ncbi:hypothetical protein CRM89_15605 [Nocardia sp. FDAARGOS_372]|nr:hypothetical protein CRM89_15605 [Nocardia sp. FDAARGOS_372]
MWWGRQQWGEDAEMVGSGVGGRAAAVQVFRRGGRGHRVPDLVDVGSSDAAHVLRACQVVGGDVFGIEGAEQIDRQRISTFGRRCPAGDGEAEFGFGGMEYRAQGLAVVLAGPTHRTAFVASDRVRVEFTTPTGGPPQVVVDRFGQFGAGHRPPRHGR